MKWGRTRAVSPMRIRASTRVLAVAINRWKLAVERGWLGLILVHVGEVLRARQIQSLLHLLLMCVVFVPNTSPNIQF